MKNEITLNGLQPGGNTLTILEGKALEEKYPVKIELDGDINSVSAFLKKRSSGFEYQKVEQEKVVVLVDKKAMYIKLFLDPQNTFGAIITGSLQLSDELKVFHINTGKMFRREELVEILKFNRLAFDNKDEHYAILKAYMAFTANTQGEVGASSDTRGNKAASFKKEVSTNIPTEFKLSIPIFKGKEALSFRVEICLDVSDAGARFWFESTDLHELIETHKEIIFNEELKSCQEFVIINK